MSVTWTAFAVLLVLGALSDLIRYRIPNAVVIALLVLFFVTAALHLNVANWTSHLLAGAVCFIVTAALYAGRMMGAGDAKLLAVLGLWAGLGPLVPFLFWTSVAGLGLVGILVTLRRSLAWTAVKVPAELPRVLRRKEGVPYGVAIAIGALLASPVFPGWLWAP